MKNNSSGMTLVEVIVAGSIMVVVAFGIMQLMQNINDGQSDAMTASDYFDMKQEIRAILSDQRSCTASLLGTEFQGSTIQKKAVGSLELWTTDQDGKRARKKFFPSSKFASKLEIEDISLSMPDYNLEENWKQGVNQSMRGEILVTGKRGSGQKKRGFRDIRIPVSVIFNTTAAGISTLVSCSTQDFSVVELPHSEECEWIGPQGGFGGAVDVKCPGDKFLTGYYSDHSSIGDRATRFKCCTLYKGETKIVKAECQTGVSANQPQSPVEHACPNQSYLAAEASSFDPGTKDRLTSYVCCKGLYKGVPSDSSVGGLAGVANVPKLPARFECPDGQAINQVRSRYTGEGPDRVFYFGCASPR